jgi:hypothetical protein
LLCNVSMLGTEGWLRDTVSHFGQLTFSSFILFQRSMHLKTLPFKVSTCLNFQSFHLQFQHVLTVIAPCGGLQPHVLTKDRRNAGGKPWPMCLRQMREKSTKSSKPADPAGWAFVICFDKNQLQLLKKH